ncbi:hypothetical protein LRS37_12880 [Neobacillus sedimentimangrovi]|uniref:Spo0E family sporulation regulatory protein-aspartic acid phosphatase n=1 Tax=Neobacillus sedimentimangrovi TaxID=2699460 RepID=A0ABS8QN69_9BACI|nr:hypothetical protein [Neobacillus sedimentimangrovi]MCD4839744.1 hypothetical protein [Neobacillus sedimentimangrovi]
MNRRMNKQVTIIGQQIVEEKVQLVLAYIQINKMLGYQKYNIMQELEELLILMKRYGIRNINTLSKALGK